MAKKKPGFMGEGTSSGKPMGSNGWPQGTQSWEAKPVGSDNAYNAEVLDRAATNPDGPFGKPIPRNKRATAYDRGRINTSQGMEEEVRSRGYTSRAANPATVEGGTLSAEGGVGPKIGGPRRAFRQAAAQVSKRGLLAATGAVAEVAGVGLLAKAAYDEAKQGKERQKQFEVDTSKQGSTNYVHAPKATGEDNSPGALRAKRRAAESSAGVAPGSFNKASFAKSGYGAPQPSNGVDEDGFMADAVVSETFAKPEADRTYSQPTMKSGGATDSTVAADIMTEATKNGTLGPALRDYNDLAGAYNELRNQGKLKQSF